MKTTPWSVVTAGAHEGSSELDAGTGVEPGWEGNATPPPPPPNSHLPSVTNVAKTTLYWSPSSAMLEGGMFCTENGVCWLEWDRPDINMNKLTAVTLEVSGLSCPQKAKIYKRNLSVAANWCIVFPVEPSPNIALYKTNIKNWESWKESGVQSLWKLPLIF